MPRFNIGDRVRVTKEHGGVLQKYTGTTGVVQEESSAPYVLMDIDGDTWAFYDDELEIVKEEKHMEFKVGQKVKITKVPWGTSMLDSKIGQIGEITRVVLNYRNGETGYNIETQDGQRWNYLRDSFELLEDIPQIKTGHLVMTTFDNQWRLAQVDIGHTQDDKSVLLNLDYFGYIRMGDYDVIKIAKVPYIGRILRAAKDGTPVEQVDGFKVIYDKTKDETKDKLQKTIDTLRDQLKQAQEELAQCQ